MSHHTQEECKAAKRVSLDILREIVDADPNDEHTPTLEIYDDGSCALNLGRFPSPERCRVAKKLLWSDRIDYDDDSNVILHSCCGLVTEARKRGLVT
jgi:hypothetical protein